MNEEDRQRILERARRSQAQNPYQPTETPAAAEPAPSARVVRTTGDVQVRIIDENNPPTEVRNHRGGVTVRPTGGGGGRGPMVLGAKISRPEDRTAGPRQRATRPHGVYGANVVVQQPPSQPAPAATPLGQALRTPQARPPATGGSAPAHGVPVAAAAGTPLQAQMDQFGQAVRAGTVPHGVSVQPVAPAAAVAAMPTAIDNLTVIMSQHARGELLDAQFRALQASGVREQQMLCWINPGGQRLNDALLSQRIPHVKASRDMGPWIRWILVSGVPTKYVLMLDDDCIPGPQWLRSALARIESAEATGEKIAIAAAGTIFQSDSFDSGMPIGPESLRREEMDVDTGRGAWLMHVEHARGVLAFPIVGCPLATQLHVAAALQHSGVAIVVLPFPHEKREMWGMLEPRKAVGSLSARFDMEAKSGGPTSEQLHAGDYQVYRDIGWEPMCVMAAAADTARIEKDELKEPDPTTESTAPAP